MSLIPVLEKERQAGPCDFQAKPGLHKKLHPGRKRTREVGESTTVVFTLPLKKEKNCFLKTTPVGKNPQEYTGLAIRN